MIETKVSINAQVSYMDIGFLHAIEIAKVITYTAVVNDIMQYIKMSLLYFVRNML